MLIEVLIEIEKRLLNLVIFFLSLYLMSGKSPLDIELENSLCTE